MCTLRINLRAWVVYTPYPYPTYSRWKSTTQKDNNNNNNNDTTTNNNNNNNNNGNWTEWSTFRGVIGWVILK